MSELDDKEEISQAPARKFPDHSINGVWGHTYFIRRDDRIKIGHTAIPAVRFRHFGVVDVLAVVPNTLISEGEAHRRFAHLRIAGEWFRDDPEIRILAAELSVKAAAAADLGAPPPKPLSAEMQALLTSVRGKIRRTREGVEKQRLELLAAQIENGAPAAFIQRQVEVLADTAGKQAP